MVSVMSELDAIEGNLSWGPRFYFSEASFLFSPSFSPWRKTLFPDFNTSPHDCRITRCVGSQTRSKGAPKPAPRSRSIDRRAARASISTRGWATVASGAFLYKQVDRMAYAAAADSIPLDQVEFQRQLIAWL